MQNKYYPHLASPLTIKGLTFKNRILGAPMSNPEMDPDSHMRKEDVAFHENRARGGLASVAIGLGIVDAVGRTHTKEVALYDVGSLPSLKEAAKAMHRHGCNAVMELAHGGKYANARGHGQAAERYALGPNDEVNPDGLPVRSMTEDEIDKYINQIAFSGVQDFLEKYKDDANAIIGHFGLGFYSAFMVAKTVDIVTLSYKEGAKAVKWSCDGSPEFTLEETHDLFQ